MPIDIITQHTSIPVKIVVEKMKNEERNLFIVHNCLFCYLENKVPFLLLYILTKCAIPENTPKGVVLL